MRRLSLVLSLTALAATAFAPSNARAADPLKLGALDLKVDGLTSLELVGRLDSSTPREQPDFLVRLDAALGWPGKAKFSSTTSFFFDGTLIDPANKYFVRDLDHVFQDTNPSLDFEEAYIDIFLPSVDLRVGKQRFSWGKLDAFNPTDVLNPLDYVRPVTGFENLSKIGVPAVKADLFPPPALGKYLPEMFSIEAVWIPFAVPYRLPKPGERWFPPLLKVPEVFALNKGEVGIETTYSDVRLPARSLGNSQYAALVKAHVGRADLVASFYDGFDRNPAAEITGSLVTTASGFLRAKPPHVDLDLDVRFLMDRIRTAGGGFSIPVWDFTVKGDFAYIQGRLANFDIASPADLLKRDPENLWRIEKEFIGNLCAGKLDQTISIGQVPVSVEKDFFSSGVQVEYLTGPWVFDVAAYEDIMFGWVQGLILPQYETRVVLNVRRTLLDEVLTVEAPVVVDVSTGDVLTLPQATYTLYDDLKATAGAIAIWGASDHLLGQFHRNDEVFAKLVFSF